MPAEDEARALRSLPKVDAVLADPRIAGLPRGVVVAATRRVLDGLREEIHGGRRDLPDVAALVREEALALLGGRLRPVINATGIVVHTNLGRAPWAPEAVAAAAAVAGAYCNVELDLDSGRRGGRAEGVTALLRHLTGAEDALVVNNNAAAVLLALTALAAGREVVVSRGELVEIGGSFRVPDVVASGGARLVEVGTTNRTRASDYASAIGPGTALLLRVHASNFRIVGFTEAPARAELVALARSRGLLLVEDQGSGSLDGARGEPSVGEAVADGVDVVAFSGDKLLGGPQAGVLVGRADVLARLRAHPLYRALRVDKVTLAALEATLAVHASGRRPPVGEMIAATPEELAPRADRLRDALVARGVAAERLAGEGFAGGGALPEVPLPSELVAVSGDAAALRARGVVARLASGRLLFDVRTVREDEIGLLADRVAEALLQG